jgi:hypothetical protein
VGFTPSEKYSAPIPRTKPEMTRPPEATSSIAISSAMRSGFSRRGRPLPRMAIFARLVRRTSMAAMTFGLAMVP